MRESVGPERGSGTAAAGEATYHHEGLLAATWRQFIRHPGAVAGSIVLILVVLASVLSFMSPYDPEKSDIQNRLQPPSWKHLMGTDPLGRDLLTRVLYGGRISLFVAVLVVAITLVIGIPVGAISGYFGGWVDNVLMRITDAALTLPSLLVLILLSAILYETELPVFERNSPMTIAVVIGLLSWMTVARLVRAGFLAIREREFVVAANAVGASDFRIVVRHILPNALSPVIVESTLEMGYAIMQESGLSFLGLGIQPPTPSWGNLLSNAQAHLSPHPWLAIFPGLMIFVTIISVNYIGDGMRDALDPHKVLTEVGEV
ncbi:MAG: ABC transporter permease [Anaerolineae bacterium]|jgi:peptide/nickel transport system permease protein